MTIPAIVLILAVFACMLSLSRGGVPLGVALVTGAIALDFCGGNGAPEVAGHLCAALASGQMWLLLAVVAMIIEFGAFMTRPENTNGLLSLVNRWAGRRGRAWAMMAIPAVLGTIPMPGGALFSAPFIQQVAGDSMSGRDAGIPAWKMAVNYWFRHVIEYWWPLYPGVIVATRIFGLDSWQSVSYTHLTLPTKRIV